jgi:hypothetical protein
MGGVVLALSVVSGHTSAAAAPLQRLTDEQYWTLLTTLSEDGGAFVSDNIVSNEIAYQQAVPDLRRVPSGRAYIGVGPEQNFTYIAASRPAIAFVVDVQRSNLYVHLLYKALLEMAHDRTNFLSMLFARPVPTAGRRADPAALFAAYATEPVSQDITTTTQAAVMTRLERVHHFQLTAEDRQGISHAYRTIYSGGPLLRGDYGGGAWIPSYADLVAATDRAGRNWGFLASDDIFRVVQEYQRRNLIIPVVGDFSGRKALRAVADQLRSRQLSVGVFYASNVEEYLFKAGAWPTFVANLSRMPVDADSLVVRTFFTHSSAGLETLLDTISGTVGSATAGDVRTYDDLIRRSRKPSIDRDRDGSQQVPTLR